MGDVSDDDLTDKMPVTARGLRTRERLLAAARETFEADGFANARITDITNRAGVAYGSFYTYFTTKEEIFTELARWVQQEMLSDPPPPPGSDVAPGSGEVSGDSSAASSAAPYHRISRANRRYLESYRRNARLMAVLDELSLMDDELRHIRREIRRVFVERTTTAISKWQADGIADPELDPRYAAHALNSMVSRFCHIWFILEEEFEMDAAVENLTRLWVQALGIAPDAPT